MGGIFSNEEPKPDLSKYITIDQLTSKNYITKDVNNLTNYQTKGNYLPGPARLGSTLLQCYLSKESQFRDLNAARQQLHM